MTTRAEHVEGTFAGWAEAREPELHRTAYLLTGDLALARAYVESALATALATDSGDPDELDRLARDALVGTIVTSRRPEGGTGDDSHDDDDPRRVLVWDFLGTLSPARRTAVVLRLHHGLDEVSVSRLVGIAPSAVRDEVSGALDDLSALLGVPPDAAAHVTLSTLARRADGTPVVPTPPEAVRTLARRRRSRRTRRGLLLVAAALVVVGVPVAALTGGGLPDPAEPVVPSPGDPPAFGRGDRVPPPWVLPPGSQTLRLDLETRCSSTAAEEFRSTTTIRAGCRTVVLEE